MSANVGQGGAAGQCISEGLTLLEMIRQRPDAAHVSAAIGCAIRSIQLGVECSRTSRALAEAVTTQ